MDSRTRTTTVYLEDGRELRIFAGVEEWQAAFRVAHRRKQIIQVEAPDGWVHVINPREVRVYGDSSCFA